jgi:glycosyltransferase involved in cell wall biosynthesis
LKANFIFSNLNPCGGGERLTLITMQAVIEMNIEIEFTTLGIPNIAKLENAYGKDLSSVINKIKKVNVLSMFDEQSIDSIMKRGYDITINTHGDIVPFHHNSLSKNNAITYCHFPSATFIIDKEDKEYLDKYLKVPNSHASSDIHTSRTDYTTICNGEKEIAKNAAAAAAAFNRKKYLVWIKDTYDNMIKNTTVMTNSKYSRNAIFGAYGIDEVIVLNPPIDVDTFRNSVLSSDYDEREDIILVVARIDPSKNIENAIDFAKSIKENGIGKGMIIAGSLDPYYSDYYSKLHKMVTDYNLESFVEFEINASLDGLLTLMRKSKAFFHPLSGEHFGMSIAEAMSAGLTPIVPDVGGQTEFVPLKYQYNTLEHAVQIAKSVFAVPYSERVSLSDSVSKFSTSNYIKQFQTVVRELLVKANFAINNKSTTQ